MGERFKIIAVTPFHQRPQISEIFWQNCNDIDLDVIAVVSDEPNRILAEKHALEVVKYENNPLGKKWQHGVERLKNYDYDYLLIIGSDDLVSHQLLDIYKHTIVEKNTKYIGLLDAVAMDFNTKKFRLFPGYDGHRKGESIGAGRLIHRELLESINYRVFPKRHQFMDRILTDNLFRIKIQNTLIKTGLKPYRIGIKSNTTFSKVMPNSPFIHNIDLKGWYSPKVIEMLIKQ